MRRFGMWKQRVRNAWRRCTQLTLSSAHESHSHLHAMGVRKRTRHAATSTIALCHGSHLLVIKARKIEHAGASAKLVGQCERRCGVATNDEQQQKSMLAQSSNLITAESAGATPRTHPFLAISAQHYTATHDPLFFPSLSRGDVQRPRARHQRAVQGGAAVLITHELWKKRLPGCG